MPWWENSNYSKLVAIHDGDKMSFSYFGPDRSARYNMELSEVKQYLTNEEFLDLQRTLFEFLV